MENFGALFAESLEADLRKIVKSLDSNEHGAFWCDLDRELLFLLRERAEEALQRPVHPSCESGVIGDQDLRQACRELGCEEIPF